MSALIRILAPVWLACAAVSGCQCRDPGQSGQAVVLPDDPSQPKAPRPPRARPAATESGPPFAEVSGEGYQGWVRPPLTPAHFAPSARDIAALEQALAAQPERGDWPADLVLATYARQYSGYRDPDGVAVIRVDLFCSGSHHLARRMVTISSGGSCFLHAAYEPESGRFRYFKRNPD